MPILIEKEPLTSGEVQIVERDNGNIVFEHWTEQDALGVGIWKTWHEIPVDTNVDAGDRTIAILRGIAAIIKRLKP